MGVLAGVAALAAGAAPSQAAYGDAANVFGKVTNKSGVLFVVLRRLRVRLVVCWLFGVCVRGWCGGWLCRGGCALTVSVEARVCGRPAVLFVGCAFHSRHPGQHSNSRNPAIQPRGHAVDAAGAANACACAAGTARHMG